MDEELFESSLEESPEEVYEEDTELAEGEEVFETPSNEQVEEVEYEYEEFEIPDYLDDDYVPQEFESAEEELEWYKDKYLDVMKYHSSEDYESRVKEKYKDELTSEIEGLKTFYQELQEDPTIALKKHAPELLNQQGVNPLIDNKEAKAYITKQMEKQFGSDFKEKYNAFEAQTDPNSLSAKMVEYDNMLLQELNKLNGRNEKGLPSVVTPEKIQERYNEQYNKYFEPKGMSKEQFDKFLDEANSMEFDLRHLYVAKNYKELLAEAKRTGYEEAKKELSGKFRKAGQTPAKTKKVASGKKKDYLSGDLGLLINQ